MACDPASQSCKRLGAVHILDPFGITGLTASVHDPLGRLDAASLDLGEDAASLAEAPVMDPPGQVSKAHWNEEAKALLAGPIMFAVAHEDPVRNTVAQTGAQRLKQPTLFPLDAFAALGRLEAVVEDGKDFLPDRVRSPPNLKPVKMHSTPNGFTHRAKAG